MAIKTIDALIAAAQACPTRTIAVAAAHDKPVIEATVEAKKANVVRPIYVGHTQKIAAMLRELGEDPADYAMVEADSEAECAAEAVALVSRGEADFLMKGILGTATLLRAVLKQEAGLTTGRLMSHIMLFETPLYPKLILMSDGGMNPAPDLQKKTEILTSAAETLQKLGYEEIFAACLSGAEVVNPKIPSTVDADALSKMDWSRYKMQVFGPVALDLAVSPEACAHKGYRVPGSGQADILLVPNYETGNALYKAVLCFAPGCTAAGLIVGARCPVVLVSRSDSAKSKLASIALGALVAR